MDDEIRLLLMKSTRFILYSFAFFFTMTRKLVEEKLVPLKANALITARSILKGSVVILF